MTSLPALPPPPNSRHRARDPERNRRELIAWFSRISLDDLGIMSYLQHTDGRVQETAMAELIRRGWEQYWDRETDGWKWRKVRFRQ